MNTITKPLVSVCIVTYQHVRFISRAIEGALMQQTDFPFEILIGEDESNDGTREICLDYARRYPDRIQVFKHSRSDVVLIDGQPRGGSNLRATLAAAQGEFIALCEGDDYWTDAGKLQQQVDYLRANPDCVGCFHDAALVDGEGAIIQASYFSSTREKFSQHDVLESLMSSYPTCSLLFRRNAWDPLPGWFMRRPCDLYIDIHLTSKGKLGFINRNMGAYRKHQGGIWSGQREANQLIELIIRYKLLLADAFFLEKYRELLLRKIDEFQAALFTRSDAGAEIDRLEKIVGDQANLIDVTRSELERMEKESNETRSNFDRQHSESSILVVSLKNQLDDLAATSQQQAGYISSLEKTRDSSEKLTVGLNLQIDQLSATSKEQAGYISILEKERDRLAALSKASVAESKRYIKVIAEQTAYIEKLEAKKKA